MPRPWLAQLLAHPYNTLFKCGMDLVTGFYRLLKTWGMDPGLEFKVAMEEAELLRARIVFGDADQDRTMRRISESLSLQVCKHHYFGPELICQELCAARMHTAPSGLAARF